MEHFGSQLQRTLVSDNGQGMMVFIVMRMCDGGATLHGAPGSCESEIEPGAFSFQAVSLVTYLSYLGLTS